jgi:integrase
MAKRVGERHKTNALTDVQVRAFKKPGRLNDGAGLSLSVTANGYRRWMFRYSYGGVQRDLFLGSAAKLVLKQARNMRDKARSILADGLDPAESLSATARKKQEAVAAGIPTFGEFAAEHLRDLSPTFSNNKARQPWELALKVYAAPLHSQRINTITTTDLANLLRPFWHSKRETARRLRWRLEAVFASAIVAGYRDKDGRGQLIQQRNPAAWKDNLEQLPGFKNTVQRAEVKHHAAMPYQHVPGFLGRLRGMDGQSARALELAILTACRTGEIIGARWEEIDLEQSLWTIPAARMKARRNHIVPLSRPALRLLKNLPRLNASPFVFPGPTEQKHMSNMALLMLLRRMDCKFTAHGFRSSFRTWASECTQFPKEIAEMALAHQVGSEAERAYNRTTLVEKRRALAETWSNYCELDAAGKVVSIRRAN